MTDIKSFWNVDEIHADWIAGEGRLLDGDDLQTAIVISLFTDRLARADDNYESTDRRGWWGDSGEKDLIGSRLWLLRRQRLTTSVALKAEEYATEALQWLIDDGVVGSISVVTQIVFPARLNMAISYSRPNGDSYEEMKFFWVWEQKTNAI
ncbi:phage GP46 family protein [Pectobacterium carotovorum]|uniref:phage GP46 family protein n=1 Tax=Pectobacterium carotovorum TaxID=554 RepID=UPI001E309B88|nr:phage GP46 family protein [Pectobacterium carotovorum]UFT92819.1 phage GP46 family protein [Pectobacterium carotovorum]